MRKKAWIVAGAWLGLASPAGAQEIELQGPIRGACTAALVRYCVPATLEWAPWVSGGIAFGVGERALPGVGVGLELTAGILDWAGPPLSGAASETKAGPTGYRAELRLGPWAYAETRAGDGAVAEGGVTFHFGTTNDNLARLVDIVPAGMFDLRLGGGYGAFPAGRAPHYAVALGWGYRVAPERSTWGGGCDPEPAPALLTDATVFRLVTTARHSPELDAWEIGVALELSPTLVMLKERAMEHERRLRSKP